MGAPALVAIDHDDYHAEHIGRTSDGRQFFLTTPFEPGHGHEGNEFVALFLFDAAGSFLEAKIDEFGPRASLDREHRNAVYEQRLRELGEVTFTRIEVAPFEVEKFGTTFGLVARAGDDEDDPWWVELHPGNYMAFTEPWDSGEYDT
ncbi:hypothetical protein DMH04_06745 [Kibdelosporangium aridum]|uniref:Uncharacterized protein n=1 Tax=Kibdelosporangium aridum TaxID=2030 RepID=A0A428ZNN5_KIBAR|nr:hypothetical protein [Kibdelosporangium aridum]RSM89664.1 hypothetical protein DMH04_06745 [Kibdelosporangium aridum]